MRLGIRLHRSFVLLAIMAIALQLDACAASTSTIPQAWRMLWQHYVEHFIDAQGRVVDHEDGGITTSEGQSYALFFALVANNKRLFGRTLAWTQDNLAQGSLAEHLPAWRWGEGKNGRWGVLDHNSAADADLWIAYTLIQAGRLWHEPRYDALGKLLADRITREEVTDVPGLGPMLLPGKTGFHQQPGVYVLNPSYLPLPILEGLAKALPDGPWALMATQMPAMMSAIAPKGFAPDWVSYTLGKGFGIASQGPYGSYNAIRVYLWAGMTDPATPGAKKILAELWGMRSYLNSHILPPLKVNATDGVASGEGPVGFSAAVIPYLERLGMKAQTENQQLRLTADLNPQTGLYGDPARYYDQNLALFAMGWLEGAFRFGRNGDLEPAW